MNSEEAFYSTETTDTVRETLIRFTDRYMDELEHIISGFQFELEKVQALSSTYRNLQTDSEILDTVDSISKKTFPKRETHISRTRELYKDLKSQYKNRVEQNTKPQQVIDSNSTIRFRNTSNGFQDSVITDDHIEILKHLGIMGFNVDS